MTDVQIKKVMETDEKGVKRQIFPITHISAVEGLGEVNGIQSNVNTVNGKSGNVKITLNDLGISPETLKKLLQIIEDYDNGHFKKTIDLEKIEEG